MDERGSKFRARGSELVTYWTAATKALLVDQAGLAPEAAEEVARDHVHEVASALGGQLLYLPRDLAYGLSKRDAKMVAEFDGRNYDDLARRYKLTAVRVRQIIDRHRREQIAARQVPLFSDSSAGGGV